MSASPARLRVAMQKSGRLAERWSVARLLDEKSRTYREIAIEAGASPTTVVRVARFLREMDHQGYRLVLDRLNKKA